MGMSFALLTHRLSSKLLWNAGVGMLYGLFVCSGLFATLLLSPQGQTVLFKLTPATAVMATVGHLVYGAMLGKTLQLSLSVTKAFQARFRFANANRLFVVSQAQAA